MPWQVMMLFSFGPALSQHGVEGDEQDGGTHTGDRRGPGARLPGLLAFCPGRLFTVHPRNSVDSSYVTQSDNTSVKRS